MAHKQVGARTEGDVYQGLFFWREAARLLQAGSQVSRVDLEHDDAAGVDDVAVFYEHPGIEAGGWLCSADFYQIKYYVDRREAYCADAFIDPGFINAKSSLLQRFHGAHQRLAPVYSGLRLHFASNWRWRDDDALASVLREYDGALPDQFFSDGAGSRLGSIRERWRSHLSLEPEVFERFARTLRLELDHFGRRHFREMVHDRLSSVGLRLPQATESASLYESLIQQFLMNGPNSFDRDALLQICKANGLLTGGQTEAEIPRRLGIRSFVRFAENIQGEVDEFVCVAANFEGRHPRNEESWGTSARTITEFLADSQRRTRLRGSEHSLALECHGSLAFLAGYELSRNSGCLAFPIQKPGQVLWRPGTTGRVEENGLWAEAIHDRNQEAADIAMAVSITHDITNQVGAYLDLEGSPQVCKLAALTPKSGAGPTSVRGADHAYQLAAELIGCLRRLRLVPGSRIHLFSSAPNALLFFLGQHREAIGAITLYEYDFGFEKNGTYQPSFSLPII